jgi:hypothetical protein
MQKIISLFQRNYDSDRLVRNEVTPGAEWVLAGEGVATRKWDGIPCKIEQGKLFKRYDAKKGKVPPAGFIAAQNPDPVTGHWPGWVECKVDNPEDRWYWEAFGNAEDELADGTYELCGPAINKNREQLDRHELIRHGIEKTYFPRGVSFEGIKEVLQHLDYEGFVWHHPDGRMVKIKAKDFGIKR